MALFDSIYLKILDKVVDYQTKKIDQAMSDFILLDYIEKYSDKNIYIESGNIFIRDTGKNNILVNFLFLDGFLVDYNLSSNQLDCEIKKEELINIWSDFELQKIVLKNIAKIEQVKNNFNETSRNLYIKVFKDLINVTINKAEIIEDLKKTFFFDYNIFITIDDEQNYKLEENPIEYINNNLIENTNDVKRKYNEKNENINDIFLYTEKIKYNKYLKFDIEIKNLEKNYINFENDINNYLNKNKVKLENNFIFSNLLRQLAKKEYINNLEDKQIIEFNKEKINIYNFLNNEYLSYNEVKKLKNGKEYFLNNLENYLKSELFNNYIQDVSLNEEDKIKILSKISEIEDVDFLIKNNILNLINDVMDVNIEFNNLNIIGHYLKICIKSGKKYLQEDIILNILEKNNFIISTNKELEENIYKMDNNLYILYEKNKLNNLISYNESNKNNKIIKL